MHEMYSSAASGERIWRIRSLGRGLCGVVFALALAWTPADAAAKESAYDALLDKLHQK